MLPTVLRAMGLMSQHRWTQHRAGVFRRLRYHDITRPWRFESGTFSAIFCSHVLEHLYFDQVESCLREAQRVLAPGGIFRIVVPDLDLICRLFDSANPEPFLDAIFENRSAKGGKNQHHWGFTFPYIARLLTSAGFATVRRCTYRTGHCPDIEALDTRPEISLYVEALK
jgi:SAM-dependent methyltransferase